MSNGPAIVIDGECPTWPSGPQTLTELPADREHDRNVFWFGTRFTPDGNEVWFRITGEAIERMPENTPQLRGARLVCALRTWLGDEPKRQLEDLDEFQVDVTNGGKTTVIRGNPAGRRQARP